MCVIAEIELIALLDSDFIMEYLDQISYISIPAAPNKAN